MTGTGIQVSIPDGWLAALSAEAEANGSTLEDFIWELASLGFEVHTDDEEVDDSRPVMRWLPIDTLHVNPAYQREATGKNSLKHIRNIAGNFRWDYFQPVSVAPGPLGMGQYWIIDGQHRVLALKALGYSAAPCWIVPEIPRADQARVFVAVNRNRKGMTSIEIHRARLTAGDKQAKRVEMILKKAGCRFAPHTNTAAGKAGEIFCVGTVYALSKRTIAAAALVLTTIKETYPGFINAHRAPLVSGVGAWLDKYRTLGGLSDRLGVKQPGAWILEGRALVEHGEARGRDASIVMAIEQDSARRSAAREAAE